MVNRSRERERAEENGTLLLAKNGFGSYRHEREDNGPEPHLAVSPCALQPRLYPVVPGNSRVPDKDICVGDYIIPKNVSRAFESLLLSHPSLSWPSSCSQTIPHKAFKLSLWPVCFSLGHNGAEEKPF